MTKINILNLEQRVDLNSEYSKIQHLLNENNCKFGAYSLSFVEIIDRTFIDFPYAGTSTSQKFYFLERGISVPMMDPITVTLYHFQFIALYLLWLKNASNDYSVSVNPYYLRSFSENETFLRRIFKQLEMVLDAINYKFYEIEDTKKYGFKPLIIVKRDSDLDSILTLVEPSVAQDLLSFYDFKIENDLTEKEAIITRLYKNILEKEKAKYKVGGTGSLYSDASEMSNFIARHYINRNLSTEEKLDICNKAFKLIIHLIRTPEIESIRQNKRMIINGE